MNALSPRALRFIEAGLDLIPDSNAKSTWAEWVGTHPTPQIYEEPLPEPILGAALAALEVEADDLERLRAHAPDEEAFYFDNDISYVRAIEGTLMRTRRLGG
jgi:hypothetical protein